MQSVNKQQQQHPSTNYRSIKTFNPELDPYPRGIRQHEYKEKQQLTKLEKYICGSELPDLYLIH